MRKQKCSGLIWLTPNTFPDGELLFQFQGSQTFSFPNKSGETDSIICPLREAPVATKPLLELKPIEGGDAQGTSVLSEKSGVELLENPIPQVRPPPWPLPTPGMAQCTGKAWWQWDGEWCHCQKGLPAGYQEVKCPAKRSYSSTSI